MGLKPHRSNLPEANNELIQCLRYGDTQAALKYWERAGEDLELLYRVHPRVYSRVPWQVAEIATAQVSQLTFIET